MLRKFSGGHLAIFQMIGCQRTQFLSLVIFEDLGVDLESINTRCFIYYQQMTQELKLITHYYVRVDVISMLHFCASFPSCGKRRSLCALYRHD